jgi:hypothetical protein
LRVLQTAIQYPKADRNTLRKVQGGIDDDPAHPALKGALEPVLPDVFKYADKSLLQDVLGLLPVTGLPAADGH